ncbi:hypothetical protein BGX24_001486 [Mortierella sp. AD032]|nr:hypothetical protein BGX24_001486 [Mortierella sp. AD032]
MTRYVGEGAEEPEIGYGSVDQANVGGEQEDYGDDGNYSIQLSSEDNISELSVASMERPKRVIRIVGLGEPSSRLYHAHWAIRNEDLSKALMESRMMLMKNHEALQRPEDIVLLNFIFTRDAILKLTKRAIHMEFPTALYKPVRCPQFLEELDTDYIKFPSMRKLSLGRQIKQGYSEAMVIGILVQGWKVQVFYMCPEHGAIYVIKSIGQF